MTVSYSSVIEIIFGAGILFADATICHMSVYGLEVNAHRCTH